MPRSSPGVTDCRPAGLPRLPPAHLPRPRLTGRLRDGDWRLRLLLAPAGFGKTVLLGECLALAPTPPWVWLSLGGRPTGLAALLKALAAPLGEPLPDERALAAVLAARTQPLWLILDDYPHDPDPDLDACLDRLLAWPDSPLRLVVSARQRPAWNLPRLLLAGELLELDASELAFDEHETQRLAERLTHPDSDWQPGPLWRETLGWCAGVPLLLAARSSAGNAGPCWLKAYLDHEVLARLETGEREDLLTLMHLPRLSLEFCAQLWEERDGAARFERLLRRHAFFLPLDRQGVWYRPLPAVARALRAHPEGHMPAALRLRACRLFAAAGQVEEAIEQALSADQPEVAASYLEQLGQEWLTGDRHLAHLLAWRERLPAPLLDSTPRLVVLNAWALLLAWRLDEAEACLATLGRFLPQADERRTQRLLANAQALRGALGALRGRSAEEARRDCREALAGLDEQDWMAALLCHSALARIAFASGHPEQAWPALNTALEQARRQGSVPFEVLLDLDRVQGLMLRGENARARQLIEASLALVARRDTRDTLLLGRLRLAQGRLHLLEDRLDAAEYRLEQGLALAQECADPQVLLAYLGLAEAAARRGRFERAFAWLGEAERRMHCQRVWRLAYMGMLSLQRMEVLAAQGNWAHVESIGRRIQRYFDDDRPWMSPCFAPDLALRNALLLARAQGAMGHVEIAREALRHVLQRAESQHLRPFCREARRALDGLDEPTFLPGAAPDAPALLSQRERAVLHLLAEGYSNEEIGSHLFISVNTVKTHAKKINCKLGVKRRTQAVMRAKHLGLLA